MNPLSHWVMVIQDVGTIHLLRKQWTGWVGSENGSFRLLSVHTYWVRGPEKVPKPDYVIFERSLKKAKHI